MNNKFSFHTLEFKAKYESKSFVEKREYFRNESKGRYRAYYKKGNFVVEKYKMNGILIYMEQNINGCFIRIRVNPMKFNGENAYYEIYDSDKITAKDILSMVDKLSNEEEFKLITNYKLFRIDFCFDLILFSQEIVDDYFRLITRAREAYPFTKTFYRDKGRRDENGVYFKAKTFEVYVYNKNRQLTNVHGENFKASKYPIRFEVRLTDIGIKDLKKKYKIKGILEFLLHIEELSYKSLEYYLPRIFLNGDYLKYEKICTTIRESKFNKLTKEKMLYIVESCMIKRDLQKAMLDATEKYKLSNLQVKDLLKHFNFLDINPICMPKRTNSNEEMLKSIPKAIGFEIL